MNARELAAESGLIPIALKRRYPFLGLTISSETIGVTHADYRLEVSVPGFSVSLQQVRSSKCSAAKDPDDACGSDRPDGELVDASMSEKNEAIIAGPAEANSFCSCEQRSDYW